MAHSDQEGEAATRPNSGRRVYITGIGPVCAFGLGVEAFAAALWDGVHRAEGLLTGDETTRADVRRVPEFDVQHYISGTRPYLDRSSEFGLAAAALALESCGVGREVPEPARTGLVIGSVFGGMASQDAFQRVVRQKGVRLASPILFPHCYANATNSLICIQFNIRGYNQNLCGDRLSGARSIEAAVAALKLERADLVLAGGCDSVCEPAVGTLADERTRSCLPPLGEGACLLALESEDAANARGAEPICEVAAAASHETGLSGPPQCAEEEERMASALRTAVADSLAGADMWEGDVGVVVRAGADGKDTLYSRAIDSALASHSQAPGVSVGARLGETFAASLPLECAAAALMVNENAIPAKAVLQNVAGGVEIWKEQDSPAMLGGSALVVGITQHTAMAIVLRAL